MPVLGSYHRILLIQKDHVIKTARNFAFCIGTAEPAEQTRTNNNKKNLFNANALPLASRTTHRCKSYHAVSQLHQCRSRGPLISGRGKLYSTKKYDTFEDQPPSWLFVSDAVAGTIGAQVNLELDLEETLSSHEGLDSMRENIEHRQIQFDLDSLVSDYEELTGLIQERQQLYARQEELLNSKRSWKRTAQYPDEETQESVHRGIKACKRSLKNVTSALWSVEDRVMRAALRLPNDLHPTTPLEESVVVKEDLCESVATHGLNHVEIGQKFDLIKFSNVGPQAYYMKGQLAQAARKLSDFACHHFQDQNYRLMSGPEFFKTPILESCGRDVYDKKEVLTMNHSSWDLEPMNHLAGVSLMTFAAYLAKVCVGDASLPLKMYSLGPHYQTATNSFGLYEAAQTSQVATFCCTRKGDAESCFHDMVDTVWKFLSSFGFSLRMTQSCASSLRREERRRMQVEIWAPGLNRFTPIASVCDHGDYISRRQMSVHNYNHSDIRHTKLLHMVSGTAVNLTTLLAVWMEHSHLLHTPEDVFKLVDLPVLSGTRADGEGRTTEPGS